MAVAEERAAESEAKRRPRPRRAIEPFGGAVPMALVAIAVTAVGFWRSFFSHLGNIDAVHMWHGASSTGWLVLVLVQATLIGSRQYRLHRIVGWSSLVLFAILLVSSWVVLALMLSGKSGIPFAFAKFPAYSDITALPLMIICYATAIILRRDRHVHSRLISVTLFAGLLPAISRVINLFWSGPEGFILSLHPTYIFDLVVLGIAILTDWKNGRLRWPFPFAFVWIAISYATLFPGSNSHWFDQLAKAIAGTA